jgi:osmotically inducible protein OsmC
MADDSVLYSTAAISRADSRNVRVEGADPPALSIADPRELGGSESGWDPERLYAAALATCLHQSVVLVASAGDVDTTHSAVRAEVQLSERGAERYEVEAHLTVELPDIPDQNRRRELLDQAVRHCPLVKGSDDVSLAPDR